MNVREAIALSSRNSSEPIAAINVCSSQYDTQGNRLNQLLADWIGKRLCTHAQLVIGTLFEIPARGRLRLSDRLAIACGTKI